MSDQNKARRNETCNEVSIGNSTTRHPDRPTNELPRTIEMLAIRALKPAAGNARTHSKKQVQEVAASVKRFGFVNPLIADDFGRIVAGHARYEAAKVLGLKQVPVIRLRHLNDTEIRAYRLADNKLAQKAGWDREILFEELTELQPSLSGALFFIWHSRRICTHV